MYGAKDYTSADVVEVRGQVTFHSDGQACEAHSSERVASGVVVWRAPLPTVGLADGPPAGAADGLLVMIERRLAAEGLRRPADRAVRWTRRDVACEHGPGAVRVEVVVAVECPEPASDS